MMNIKKKKKKKKKKNELPARVINLSSDTDFDEFKRLYRKKYFKIMFIFDY